MSNRPHNQSNTSSRDRPRGPVIRNPNLLLSDQINPITPILPEYLETSRATIVQLDLPNVNRLPNVFGCTRETHAQIVSTRPDIEHMMTFQAQMPNGRIIFQLRDGNNLFCLSELTTATGRVSVVPRSPSASADPRES